MTIFLNIIFGLIALFVIGFAVLGLISRKKIPFGLKDGKLASLPRSPNCVCSESGTPKTKSVSPLPTDDMDAVEAAIIATGGQVNEKSENYIAATYKSPVFGFVDDVEIRKGNGVAHIRSASRVGYSDRGVNRKRVEAIRAAL